MNSLIIVLFALVAGAAAYGGYNNNDGYYNNDPYHGNNNYGYGYGFRRTPYGAEAAYNNAARQKGVNYLAERVGASSGTARLYGVPGTGRYFGASYYRGQSKY